MKRSYEDGCAAAHALDLIGERWALLVARELLLGPKRFTDLRAGLPGISPNVLSQRLAELEAVAIIHRLKLPPPVGSSVYQLTEWGRELEPLIIQLGRWGARSPFMDRDAKLSADSIVLSFRSMFDSSAAEGFHGRFELRFGHDVFRASVQGGRFEINRGTPSSPDAVIESDPSKLAAVVYDGADLDSSGVRISGDLAAAQAFLKLFSLPEKASIGS